MVDVSNLTGQRISRGRRSSGSTGKRDVGLTSLQTGMAREVRDGTNAARVATHFHAASEGLASFYPWLRAKEQARYASEKKKQNQNIEDQIKLDNAKLAKDPKGAQRAINEGKTVEYFGDEYGVRDHRLVQGNLTEMTSKILASEKAPEVDRLLEEASKAGKDPSEALNEYIEKGQEGMDPLMSGDWSIAVRNAAQKKINEIGTNQTLAGQQQLAETTDQAIGLDLTNPDFVLNDKSFDKWREQYAMAYPGDKYEGLSAAKAAIDNKVLTHAAAGDHTAIQALDIPDSNNETLRQRDPEGALKAEQAWIAKQRALKDTQSYQFFENMEDRLALAQRGQFAEGDSLQNMWDETFRFDSYAGGDTRDSMLSRIEGAMHNKDAYTSDPTAFRQINSQGEATNQHVKAAQAGAYDVLMGRQEGSFEDAAWVFNQYGFNKDQSDGIKNWIRGADQLDPGVIRRLHGVWQSGSPAARRTMFGDGAERAIGIAMLDAVQTGKDPQAVRDAILERDYQGKPEGYIEKMIESGDAGITLNRNQKASDAAEEIYEDAWDAYREVSDLYKDTEWEDLGPTEKEHVRDTVNYQALAQTGKLDFGDGGPLMTNTAEALRYDFSPNIRADGSVTPKTGYFAPPLVKNADGQIRAGTPMTKQSIAKFEREVMRQEDINNTEEWAGDIIGVSNDPLTLDALGASVTVDWGYGEMPGYFPTSRQMAAPTAALRRHPELMKYVEEIETIGSQTFFAFRAPEDTTKDLKVKMDSGLFMAWSSKYKVWALRWSEDGAPGVPKGVPSDMYGRTSPEFTTEKPFDGPVTLQEHRDAHKKRQAEERKKREQGYGLEMGYGG